MAEAAPDETSERAKYEAMWAREEYRRYSPGEALVGMAIEALGIGPCDYVIDYGCGSGRAAQHLARVAAAVTAIDIAPNCLDPDVDVDFVTACLWDLPPDIGPADIAFCADVMEHIPPHKVSAVIESIAQHTTRGAFFQISTVPDGCGKLIGQSLHLTVRPAPWWHRQLGEHWAGVDCLADGASAIFTCESSRSSLPIST